MGNFIWKVWEFYFFAQWDLLGCHAANEIKDWIVVICLQESWRRSRKLWIFLHTIKVFVWKPWHFSNNLIGQMGCCSWNNLLSKAGATPTHHYHVMQPPTHNTLKEWWWSAELSVHLHSSFFFLLNKPKQNQNIKYLTKKPPSNTSCWRASRWPGFQFWFSVICLRSWISKG